MLPCNHFCVSIFTLYPKILFRNFRKQRVGYHLVYNRSTPLRIFSTLMKPHHNLLLRCINTPLRFINCYFSLIVVHIILYSGRFFSYLFKSNIKVSNVYQEIAHMTLGYNLCKCTIFTSN
jgi:hypothetical protein